MSEQSNTKHVSVLLHEVIQGLNIKKGDVVLDGTLGGGGHSESILESATPITLIGLDADTDAIERSSKRLEKFRTPRGDNQNEVQTIHLVESNSVHLDIVLKDLGIKKISKAVFDLGWSSDQLEVSKRGFSFMRDEPLQMTFAKTPGEHDVTAYDLVNTFEEENIADIIYGFGGEQFSRRIARAIIEVRGKEGETPIKTTAQLAKIVEDAVPKWYSLKKTNPATKTFQAIRIAVNKEIENLPVILAKTWDILEVGGVIAVISFHSLEDRIVKTFLKDKIAEGLADKTYKKPIMPSQAERKANPRSRSAVLRIIKKIA
jgi:16S rRNA (cytosine1402-N4)-methyltransferase